MARPPGPPREGREPCCGDGAKIARSSEHPQGPAVLEARAGGRAFVSMWRCAGRCRLGVCVGRWGVTSPRLHSLQPSHSSALPRGICTGVGPPFGFRSLSCSPRLLLPPLGNVFFSPALPGPLHIFVRTLFHRAFTDTIPLQIELVCIRGT